MQHAVADCAQFADGQWNAGGIHLTAGQSTAESLRGHAIRSALSTRELRPSDTEEMASSRAVRVEDTSHPDMPAVTIGAFSRERLNSASNVSRISTLIRCP